MISYPASLLAVGGARTGIAPVNLLDVQDVNGNVYLWSDRKILAPSVIFGSGAYPEVAAAGVTPPVAVPAGQQVAWALPSNFSALAASEATATATALGGFLSVSGGGSSASAEWSGFTMPALPAGTVIQSVHQVIKSAANSVGATGNASVMSSAGLSIAHGGQFRGQTYVEMAATSAAVTGATISASIANSVSGDGSYQDLTVSFVGIAIYYTTSSSRSGFYQYEPWLLSVPKFSFHRSLQADTGSFVLQNVSGDSLSRDFERLWRASALEGAFFVYRCWQPDAEASWLEVHGTFSVSNPGVDTAPLTGSQLLNPAQDDTPLETYCETCQLQWGGKRCGSTEETECSYSFQTCQVPERIMVVMNNYEKNYGETAANTALNVINRRRTI
jgi:hypothetical protein